MNLLKSLAQSLINICYESSLLRSAVLIRGGGGGSELHFSITVVVVVGGGGGGGGGPHSQTSIQALVMQYSGKGIDSCQQLSSC